MSAGIAALALGATAATAASVAAVGVGVIGIGMSAYSSSQQAKAQKQQQEAQRKAQVEQAASQINASIYQAEAGGRQQAITAFEAAQIYKNTSDNVRQIRRGAIEARAKQVAQLTSSGVMIGDGSAQTLIDETTNLAEQDVMATLYNGYIAALSKEEAGRIGGEESLQASAAMKQQANLSLVGVQTAPSPWAANAGSLLGQTAGVLGAASKVNWGGITNTPSSTSQG